MKRPFILLFLLLQLAACSVFRSGTRETDNLSARGNGSSSGNSPSPVFIQNITTESGGNSLHPTDASFYGKSSPKTGLAPVSSEGYAQLQFKYAILTNSPVEELTNQRLLVFMDQWYGAPYHYGGNSKDGIDCSAFASLLMSNVYNVNQLPRISADQYRETRRVSKKDLREGDLVFFHTQARSRKVTHVGVYLYNNRFVHASVDGVQISDLGEGYYQQRYVGAGRAIDE